MTSKLKQLESTLGSRKFRIEQDMPEIGWYLKVYENGKCIADHLQDNLEAVVQQAEEQYSVPSNSWREV